MNRKILLGTISALTVAGVLAASVAPAVARGEGRGGFGPHAGGLGGASFAELDANGDGQISADEITAFGQARFSAADTDGNGGLSAEEMAAQVEERRAQRMAERVAERLRVIDADGNGEVSFEEMADMGNLEQMFRRIDTDGDKAISAEEFAAMEAMRGGGKPMKRWGRGQN